MNNRQKHLIINLISIVTITTVFVIIMMNVKDMLNKSESMTAMNQIGREIIKHRKLNNSLPPEHVIQQNRPNIAGSARLGTLHYRAMWIGYDADDNTILAYTKKNYRSFFLKSGYVVLKLDGSVEWINEREFEELFKDQKSPTEPDMGSSLP